jgi:DNA-binding CsgD family transcriptional regulator
MVQVCAGSDMQTALQTITRIIRAIGDDSLPGVAAQELCRFTEFELSTMVLHRPETKPKLMFDNFDSVGCGKGIQNYLSFTHEVNPVLQSQAGSGAFRARDFKGKQQPEKLAQPYLVNAPEEELGFRTIGWPSGLEELGLYFKACGGVVEFCVYRERTRTWASDAKLVDLKALCEPIAEAFRRHEVLSRSPIAQRVPAAKLLSPREGEVTDLLLAGCTSEAIGLRLRISLHTVRDYRKQIFRKLSVCSLAELFALYRDHTN